MKITKINEDKLTYNKFVFQRRGENILFFEKEYDKRNNLLLQITEVGKFCNFYVALEVLHNNIVAKATILMPDDTKKEKKCRLGTKKFNSFHKRIEEVIHEDDLLYDVLTDITNFVENKI